MSDLADTFAQSMQRFGLDRPGGSVAVAVSGGGDSLALTLLMREWAAARQVSLRAFTVDHGLRDGSRAEAERLQALLSARGIRHDILSWQGDKPVTHIQERAREARYMLLLDACHRENIPVLAVAHNLEDQIETFWMRLSKGSGLDGLAAMAPSRTAGGIHIVRPLLSFSRADLRQACRDFGADWVEDPSNGNEKFLRVKLRQFEELLAGEGLTPKRLAQTLQKLEESRDALQVFAQVAAAQVLEFSAGGFARLKGKPFLALPADIQRRILSLALLSVAPRPYAPGFEALEELRADMSQDGFAGRTLGGCEIFPGKNGEVFISRETASAPPRAPLTDGLLWDGRFRVSGYRAESQTPPAPEIGFLGEEGLAQLRQKNPEESAFFAALESLPFKLRRMLPALWKGQNLLSIPYLNWAAPGADDDLAAVRVTYAPMGVEKDAGA